MSQQTFKIGDNVHIKAPGHFLDGREGSLVRWHSDIDKWSVQTNAGIGVLFSYELELCPGNPPRDSHPAPQRDAISPQPAPTLPPRTREQEEVIRKLEEAARTTKGTTRTFLPVQTGEVETLPNGAKQSKLGHWWSTPYAALAVARVMSEGHAKYDEPGTTPAQGNWHGIPVWSNIQHALTHLMLYAVHDKTEDHLAHAATRLMMALDQRESGRDKPKDTRGDYPIGD